MSWFIRFLETRRWVVYFEAVIQSSMERDVIATFGFNSSLKERKIHLYPESQKIKLGSLQIEDHLVELWWPRGYGKQILYDAHVSTLWNRRLNLLQNNCSEKVLKISTNTPVMQSSLVKLQAKYKFLQLITSSCY